MNLGHGRAQLQKVTAGGTRDGKITHLRLELYQDSGGFAEIGTILGAAFTRGMASAVYDIPNIECRCISVVDEHHPGGRVPRRRPPGGHRCRRARDGPVRPRDRHGRRSTCAART